MRRRSGHSYTVGTARRTPAAEATGRIPRRPARRWSSVNRQRVVGASHTQTPFACEVRRTYGDITERTHCTVELAVHSLPPKKRQVWLRNSSSKWPVGVVGESSGIASTV